MVVVLKSNYDEKQLDNLINWFNEQGVESRLVKGSQSTILGLVGDTSVLDIDLIKAVDIVESVKRIQEPYKNVNRKFHPDDTVIDVCGYKVGGGNFQFIAGPCSVESSQQICYIAQSVKKSGANLLRGGAFKPRTSPYSFQGLRAEGLELLLEAKQLT
ncbi:MAG: 3-deoxy-7-phosphoheptulonate synthase, partial [Clostridiales bacterium]|nr:3-deoxy-7-phosphoheptulonate synthase [Clostridiales bacterium]